MRNLKFEESIVVRAVNRSGGMVLMWDNDVRVIEALQSFFTLEEHIVDLDTQVDWWFIRIYASGKHQVRKISAKSSEKGKEFGELDGL